MIRFMWRIEGASCEYLCKINKFAGNLNYSDQSTPFLSLPKWAEIALNADNTLEYLAAAHLETFTHTTELKKLEAGTIIKEMLDRFKNKTLSHLNPDRSLWIYAAHDLTLINILNALDLYDVSLFT